MNIEDIYKFSQSDPVCKNIFSGVLARNELPIINKLPCAFILNTHKKNQTGEHWLAF